MPPPDDEDDSDDKISMLSKRYTRCSVAKLRKRTDSILQQKRKEVKKEIVQEKKKINIIKNENGEIYKITMLTVNNEEKDTTITLKNNCFLIGDKQFEYNKVKEFERMEDDEGVIYEAELPEKCILVVEESEKIRDKFEEVFIELVVQHNK